METMQTPDAVMEIVKDMIATDRRAAAINTLLEWYDLSAAMRIVYPARQPQVGDILECSWGYGQTRVDFYQVTKVTAKTVTCQEIAKRYVTNQGHGEATVMPVAGAFDTSEKPLKAHRFSFPTDSWRGESQWRYSIRVNSYSHAYLWDGEACGESGDY